MPSHPFSRSFHALLAGAVVLLMAFSAGGGELRTEGPPLHDADALIDACESRYAASLGSGERQRTESGYIGLMRCIRGAALERAVLLLGEDRRGRISESFEQIENGFQAFYDTLNDGALGTVEPSWASELGDAYADILHDVVRQQQLRAPM